MTLREFESCLNDEVKKFVGWWLSKNNYEPGDFPMEMDIEEWIEKFNIFLTL